MNVTPLSVMDDPNLFGRWFQGDTWTAWRAFLAALFGLLLEPEAQATYQCHTRRSDAPGQQFREAFVIAGRRSGKSLIAAMVAVFLAVFRSYDAVLAPGEKGVVMILASDRRQARVLLGYVNGFFDLIPMLQQMVVARLKESVELTNRIRIEIHTSSFRAVRGYTIVAAICDEIAFWLSDDSANPDSEVLAALRPAMATVPGALLLAISSPYSRRGALWETYQKHFGKKGSPVLVWQAASREMNPSLTQSVIDEAIARDPIAAASEYEAKFRADLEAFVSREICDACITKGRFESPRMFTVHYTAFVDPSGGSSDSMTLAVAHKDKAGNAILDLLREKKPPFSPEAVVTEFAQILKSYGISEVTGDAYAGEWPRERFAAHHISYKCAEKSRSEIYIEFLPF